MPKLGVKEQTRRLQLWVDALESGAYKQGRGVLRRLVAKNIVEHCVLGVGCDVYRKNTGKGYWVDGRVREAASEFVAVGKGQRSYGTLPKVVAKWFGVKVPVFVASGRSLASLNDSGQSFGDIAFLMRKQFGLPTLPKEVKRGKQ